MRLISESDYIAHHGIKGQKWGIRRYRNPDGTLTEAGKKHYLKQIDRAYKKDIARSRNGRKERTHLESEQEQIRDMISRTAEYKNVQKIRAKSEKEFQKMLDSYVNSSKRPDYRSDEYEDFTDKWINSRPAHNLHEANKKLRIREGEIYAANRAYLMVAKMRDLNIPTNDAAIRDLFREYHLQKYPGDVNFESLT